jgi:hypothetical protein
MKLAADKKRLMILAGLTIGLMAVLVFRFVLADGAASGASASSGGAALSSAGDFGLSQTDPNHLERVAKIARARSKAVYTGGDARDPMRPLVVERSSATADRRDSEDSSDSVALPPMSLYGIIWDPESPIALIDGMDLHEGDRIKGARIVEIGIDRVVLSYRSRQFVLTVQ